MSEMPEMPEDLPTVQPGDESENVPDRVDPATEPPRPWFEQALRNALANFDEHALRFIRDLLHRAGRSSSNEDYSYNHQDSESSADSSGVFE